MIEAAHVCHWAAELRARQQRRPICRLRPTEAEAAAPPPRGLIQFEPPNLSQARLRCGGRGFGGWIARKFGPASRPQVLELRVGGGGKFGAKQISQIGI